MVRAVAKGVRKTSSRFGSRVEPFMVSDVQLAEGRSLHTLTQAVSVASYGLSIVRDLDAYMYASAIAELVEVIAEAHDAEGYFALTIGALAALARQAYPPQQIFDAFALRALSHAGWDMAVDTCAMTGEVVSLSSFSAPHGGVLSTPNTRIPGATILVPGARELLSSLKSGDWQAVLASTDQARRQAHALTLAYLGWHTEKTLSSLTRFERSL